MLRPARRGPQPHRLASACCILALLSQLSPRALSQPSTSPPGSYSCSATQPGFSHHNCLGETADRRACRFRNLYYDTLGNGSWVFYESPDEPPEIKLGGQNSASYNFDHPLGPPLGVNRATDAFFYSPDFIRTLSHENPWGGGAGSGTNITLLRTAPPPLDQVDLRPGVSLIWNFFQFSSYSYGHCLLNDWFPIAFIMDAHFSEAIPPFHVILQGPIAPLVCLHYIGPFSRGPPPVTLAVLAANATSQSKRYLRFCDILIGDAGYQRVSIDGVGFPTGQMPHNPEPLFDAGTMRTFKRAVYRAHGVRTAHPFNTHSNASSVAAAGTGHHVPHISVLNKDIIPNSQNAKEYRKFLNTLEVVEHLRGQFPGATVAALDFAKLTPGEQVHAMSKTSVFITTQGSASFRHVFLPRGARVILVGSPISPTANWGGVFGNTAFWELIHYFQVSDYKVNKYPMLLEAPEWNVTRALTFNNELWDMYCMDFTLNLTRITDYVKTALSEVARGRQWLSDIDVSA